MLHRGQCHCGEVWVEFETSSPLAPRACQCRFCRKQNARMVSDPRGSAALTLGPQARRYRFGTMATDFLLCGRCGVYLAAVADLGGQCFATLNLNAFEDPRPDLVGEPMVYDGEAAASKVERRRRKWTPTRIIER